MPPIYKDRPYGSSSRRQSRPSFKFFYIVAGGLLALLFLLRPHANPYTYSIDEHEMFITGSRNGMTVQRRATGNIALAYAYGADLAIDRLAIFVLSFTTHSPGTKLIIFTSPDLMAKRIVSDIYAQAGVEGVAFTPYDNFENSQAEIKSPGRVPLGALQHYLLYLERHPGDVSKGVAVLGAVQDIAFQGDVFSHPSVATAVVLGRVLVHEQGGPQLGPVACRDQQEAYTSIEDCYGAPGTASIGPNTLLSTEFIVGRRDVALHYIRLMSDILDTRVRFKCLRNPRPDVAALTHAVYEIGKQPLNLDFNFTIAAYNDVTAPVLGAAYGFPAVIDPFGIVHKMKDSKSKTRAGPIPPVITDYAAHPTLLKIFKTRYLAEPIGLEFLQTSGYIGKFMDNDDGSLPVSWENEVEDRVVNSGAVSEEGIVQEMIEARAGTASRKRKEYSKIMRMERLERKKAKMNKKAQGNGDYDERGNVVAAGGGHHTEKKLK